MYLYTMNMVWVCFSKCGQSNTCGLPSLICLYCLVIKWPAVVHFCVINPRTFACFILIYGLARQLLSLLWISPFYNTTVHIWEKAADTQIDRSTPAIHPDRDWFQSEISRGAVLAGSVRCNQHLIRCDQPTMDQQLDQTVLWHTQVN